MLVDLRNKGEELTGKLAETALDKAGITVNKKSGLRIGTPAVTTRGMKEPEMRRIADFIDRVLRSPQDDAVLDSVKGQVRELAAEYPLYPTPVITAH